MRTNFVLLAITVTGSQLVTGVKCAEGADFGDYRDGEGRRAKEVTVTDRTEKWGTVNSLVNNLIR